MVVVVVVEFWTTYFKTVELGSCFTFHSAVVVELLYDT